MSNPIWYAVYGKGDWLCMREHMHPSATSFGTHGPMRFETFSEYAMDFAHHLGMWHWLVETGFIDTPTGTDWEPVFWRWDFWNAKVATQIQKLEHERWLKKRAESIVKWGPEGAL